MLHAGGSLFQRRCLLFGTRREIVIAAGNFRSTTPDILAPGANGTDRFAQAVLHRRQQRHQLAHAVTAKGSNRLAEIALGNLTKVLADLIQRLHQHRNQVAIGEEQDQQANQGRGDDHRAGEASKAVHRHAGAIENAVGSFIELTGTLTKGAT